VEDISGRAFADYMDERVLGPLNMTRSGFLRTKEIGSTLVTGYH
jgi:CubicO group peptidase (beta-lactamase class C family)